MAHPYNGLLPSTEKEGILYHLGKCQKRYAKHSIKFHITKILANGNLAYNSDRKSRSVIGYGGIQEKELQAVIMRDGGQRVMGLIPDPEEEQFGPTAKLKIRLWELEREAEVSEGDSP